MKVNLDTIPKVLWDKSEDLHTLHLALEAAETALRAIRLPPGSEPTETLVLVAKRRIDEAFQASIKAATRWEKRERRWKTAFWSMVAAAITVPLLSDLARIWP